MSAVKETGTYDRLLQAAEDEFAAAGYAGASLQSIANATGISKASLFHYFASKEQLYRAVIQLIFQRLQLIFHNNPPPNDSGDPFAQIFHTVGLLHDIIATNPNFSRILLHRILEDSERVREGSRTLIKPLIDTSAAFIQRGSDSGVFRKLDPVHTALSILSMVMFFYAAAPLSEACTGAPVFTAEAIAARREQLLRQVAAIITPEGGRDSTNHRTAASPNPRI